MIPTPPIPVVMCSAKPFTAGQALTDRPSAVILSWLPTGGSAGISTAAIITNFGAQILNVRVRVAARPTITQNCAVIRIPTSVKVYATASTCEACATEVHKDELLIWNRERTQFEEAK